MACLVSISNTVARAFASFGPCAANPLSARLPVNSTELERNKCQRSADRIRANMLARDTHRGSLRTMSSAVCMQGEAQRKTARMCWVVHRSEGAAVGCVATSASAGDPAAPRASTQNRQAIKVLRQTWLARPHVGIALAQYRATPCKPRVACAVNRRKSWLASK